MDAARDEPGFREPATGPSDRELAQAVQSLPRDDPRRAAALTELVARYQSLVRACVHRYRSSPESADDLMQVGYLEAQLAGAAFQASSLDIPLSADDGSASLAEQLGEEDPGLEQALDMHAVWTHLPELPEREQRLLMMRFYGNMTQTQIAAKLGLSQMHVSRLLSHALGHLRNRINDPGPPAETAPVSP